MNIIIRLLPNCYQTDDSVAGSNRLTIMLSKKSHGKLKDIFRSNLGNNCPKNYDMPMSANCGRTVGLLKLLNNKPKMTSEPNVSQKPTGMAGIEFEDLMMSLLGRFWTLRKNVLSLWSQWTINVITNLSRNLLTPKFSARRQIPSLHRRPRETSIGDLRKSNTK